VSGAGIADRVRIRQVETLADDWYVLRKYTFDQRRADGTWQTVSREAYDRGNGAVVLPYDRARGTVVLTRQFRLPAFVNGHPDGMLLEAPAGLLDAEAPEEAVRREAEEETGLPPPARRAGDGGVHEPGLGDRAAPLLRGRSTSAATAPPAAADRPRRARTSR
jgi:hypothetical protein